MHVIFIGSYTCRKGKVTVQCTLTHCASPQDTQPAGLLGAPLLNCGQCQGLRIKCWPALQTHKMTAGATPSSGMTRWLTQLWPHVIPGTRFHSWMFCMDTWSPMPDTLFSSFLLLPSLFPINALPPPPQPCSFPLSYFAYLCPKDTAAIGSCQPSHFTYLFFLSTYTSLCTLWVNFSRPALLEWGASWISRIHFNLLRLLTIHCKYWYRNN